MPQGLIKGIRQIVEDTGATLQEGLIYFIRKEEDTSGQSGYIFFNGKKYGNVDVVNGLPDVTASDDLKVLQVREGEWEVVTPLVVYSGEQTPPQALGNNGDIYLQTAEMLRKPDVLYETDGTTGLLGHNQNSFANLWQLENLDMTPYKYIKAYIKCAATGDSSTYTSAIVVTVPLDPAAMGPTAYMGSAMAPLPFNRNRQFLVTCAVDSTKTKFQVVHENTIWDATTSDANDKGRYCYKIEGWY